MTTNQDHKAQGIRLKNRRKALGLSANDLAKKMQEHGQQVSRGAIANWECGKNGIIASKLPALAKILQVSENYLLTGKGDLLDMMDDEFAKHDDHKHQQKPSKFAKKDNPLTKTLADLSSALADLSEKPNLTSTNKAQLQTDVDIGYDLQSDLQPDLDTQLQVRLYEQQDTNAFANKQESDQATNNPIQNQSPTPIDKTSDTDTSNHLPNKKPSRLPVPMLSLDDLRADAPSALTNPKAHLDTELPTLANQSVFDEFFINHILHTTDMTMPTTPALKKSQKLANVCYDIRGPLLQMANQMEAEGQQIIKLNIGNPAPFGLFAPDEIIKDVASNLHNAEGYSDSRGIFSARKAILQYYQSKGLLSATDVNDVYIGNGVSELIVMAMQALLDDGDEVLIPMPDYPLWTAATHLAGGKAAHYRCDEDNDWQPNLADIESKITDKTKAIVVINPNNPTGAVYGDETLRQIAQLASKHNLVLMADEIYDRILYDGVTHTPMCTLAKDCLVLSFNGLSKSHRIAGFRSGWLMLSGKKDHAQDFIEGLTMLASMRLCANVPAQHAIQTAMGGYQSMQALTAENGRLNKQRMMAYNRLNAIKGVSCTLPKGAFYCFVKLDLSVYPIENDMEFMMDLLKEEKVLMVQGTGFNWDKPDHFRVVFLPNVLDLEEAMDRLERFFAKKRLQFGTE